MWAAPPLWCCSTVPRSSLAAWLAVRLLPNAIPARSSLPFCNHWALSWSPAPFKPWPRRHRRQPQQRRHQRRVLRGPFSRHPAGISAVRRSQWSQTGVCRWLLRWRGRACRHVAAHEPYLEVCIRNRTLVPDCATLIPSSRKSMPAQLRLSLTLASQDDMFI